jgi:hypothetical protein
MTSDAEYFRERAHKERLAALAADRPSVRLRHLEFAQAYELRSRLTEELTSSVELADAAA